MLPVKTIIHSTDFSDSSQAAFTLACAVARDFGAKLVLVHVAPIEIVYGGMIGVPMEPYPYLHTLEQQLDALRASCEGISAETHLREGLAVDEILAVAEEVHADLIVMGTHGRSGVGRLLLGSVAEGIMRKARCPVLTVKQPAEVEAKEPEAHATAMA